MDEARLGLKPIGGRVWAPKGQRPIRDVFPRYEWVYLMSAVEPASGHAFSMIWDGISLEVMQIWVDQFAESLAPIDVAVLLMDGAGWHSIKGIRWPQNVVPLFIPPYSPELNPAERLWTWVRERLANRVFNTLKDLVDAIANVVAGWNKHKADLKSMTLYHWIEEAIIRL